MNRTFEIFSHVKTWKRQGLSSNLLDFNNFRLLISSGLDLVFPPLCLICREKREIMLAPTFCETCFRNAYDPESVSPFGKACGRYAEHIRSAIVLTKFKANPVHLPFLTRLIQEGTHSYSNADYDLVTFIPGEPSRVRQRGFHFAGYLARIVAQQLNLPLRSNLLRRTRKVARQQSLDRERRLTNMPGALKSVQDLSGQKILLVDDIHTTGATLSEASRALKASGSRTVNALVLAHTPDY
jgi:ComF family protein